jgi:hypothetical protein
MSARPDDDHWPAAPAAPRQPPRMADDDQLALIAAEHPEFRIWREATYARSRYICRSLDLHVNPHTLVTGSLDELAAELSAARRRRERTTPSRICA